MTHISKLLVLNDDKSIDFKYSQELNISLISVTLTVLNEDKFNDFKEQ